MKGLVNALIVIALISLTVGVISRFTLVPVWGIRARSFLIFTNTSLLFAITLMLLKCKSKGE